MIVGGMRVAGLQHGMPPPLQRQQHAKRDETETVAAQMLAEGEVEVKQLVAWSSLLEMQRRRRHMSCVQPVYRRLVQVL